MKIWIIYCHLFPNGKRYIGRTCQKLYNRFRNGQGYKSCPLMDKAIEKYKWENIEHIILEDNLTEEESIEREQYYIELYGTDNYENGYNLSKGGEGFLQYNYEDILSLWKEGEHSVKDIAEKVGCCRNTVTHVLRQNNILAEETQERHTLKQLQEADKVKQYDLNGKYLATYNSCGEACRINNWINKGRGTDIRRACEGKRPTARGFLWSWDDGTCDDLNIDIKQIKRIRNKKVGQYTLNGELIQTFENVTEAAEKVMGDKNSSGKISAVCYGKRKTSHGFIWKFI